ELPIHHCLSVAGICVSDGNTAEDLFPQECLGRQIESVADRAAGDQGIFGKRVLTNLRSVVPENVENTALKMHAPTIQSHFGPRSVPRGGSGGIGLRSVLWERQ